jgi:hypothetical protein
VLIVGPLALVPTVGTLLSDGGNDTPGGLEHPTGFGVRDGLVISRVAPVDRPGVQQVEIFRSEPPAIPVRKLPDELDEVVDLPDRDGTSDL